jgi:peptidoglycan/LPS O-acetylase OafA/YrhL
VDFIKKEQGMTTKQKRIHWMDNLRTITIFLVVLYHIGGVYEAAGLWGWFWIVDDPATMTWVGIMGIVFDIMVIPTLFFISGYLTPASLNNRTGWGFIKGKLRRLMLPWLVAVLTLMPLYKFFFLYSRGLPQEHWSTYFHFSKESITSQNWLWYLPVLFVFNLLYLLLSKTKIKMPKISLAVAVAGVFVLGLAYSYFIGGLLGFRSWTKSILIDFENERLLVNLLIYLLGVLYYQRAVFASKPKSKTLYMVANSLAWLPITAHIFARLYPFLYPQSYAVTPLYRLIWWSSFHLSTLSMVYVMVESFWRYVDKGGTVWRELNKNSYGVYIIHVIVIGIFGTLLLNMDRPAMLKYVLLILSVYLGSNLIVALYRFVLNSSRHKDTLQAGDVE